MARHPSISLAVLLASVLSAVFTSIAAVQPAFALSSSQNVALVPSSSGRSNFGGVLPTTGFPGGYAPTFTNVPPEAIRDNATDPLTGFDTVALIGICDIDTFLANTQFKSRIEGFVSAGGKLIIWDSECTTTNYSKFVFPFTSNNPGAQGANGTLTDLEENSLSSSIPTSPSYLNVGAISTGTDAVGDANVFVTFNQSWCVDLRAANINGVVGPTQTYARLGSGLIIYSGLDKDAAGSGGFDPTSSSGTVHLNRVWLLELLQPFNPDTLPCGVKVFGLALSPKTATNPAGSSHTVTARLTSNAAPQPNATVSFTITAGPNAGVTGTGVTNANGDATFTYSSNGTAGTDTIQASATLPGTGGVPTTVTDTATKTWIQTNRPPTATAGGPYAGNEGGPIVLKGVASDPDGDTLSISWVVTPGSGTDPGAACAIANGNTLTPTITCNDDGTFTATVTVSDGKAPPVSSSAAVIVANVAPKLSITAPANGTPLALNAPLTLVGSFTDPGSNDTQTCAINWGDGTSDNFAATPGSCNKTHTYTTTGTYTIQVTVADDDGGTDTRSVKVVAYKPTQFVIWGGNKPNLADAVRLGETYQFWGAQWEKQVTAGDYQSNGSFKGYADQAVGATWTSTPGNSSNPSATLADYIGVIVTTHVAKNGSVESGNVAEIVVLQVIDPAAYQPDPGHPASGVVVAIVP